VDARRCSAVGTEGCARRYPLLTKDYAARIAFDAEALAATLPASEQQLALGALLGDIGVPLYLAGSWHIFRGVRMAGPWTAWPIFLLLICGNAWSPLGHAAFYYVAMVYKTILATPREAHDALLTLGNQFNDVLMIVWLMPVIGLALGLLLLGIAAARGKTRYPRWTALFFNPFAWVGIGLGVAMASPEPFQTLLGGAAFNVSWFVFYAISIVCLWNAPKEAANP
jgi:hypothetical protein